MKRSESKERQATYDEIKATIGIVPKFLQQLPDEILESEWRIFKATHVTEGALSGKVKELIGLGIAGAARCTYCTEYHMTVAKLFGATDEEINETLLFAKESTGWSTFLNGSRYDHDEFHRELQAIVDFVSKRQKGEKAA